MTSEARDAHLRGRSAAPGEHCRSIGETRRKRKIRRVELPPSLIAAGNAAFHSHVCHLSHIASFTIVPITAAHLPQRKHNQAHPQSGRTAARRRGVQAPSKQRGQRTMDPTLDFPLDADIDIDIDIPSGVGGVGGPTAAEGESPASPSASPAPPGQRTPA